ncbi:MAG: MerR family transcriptional regulator [Chloroflexota bacterium]
MYSIGEFAKIGAVSKRLLDHYDEIGLLKPEKIDRSTGYRFYSAKQLSNLNQILALKDLGMSLQEIKKMVTDEISDEEIHGMLLLKKSEVERSIAEDFERLRRVEARLKHNRETEMPLDIVIKSTEEQPYLAAEFSYLIDEKAKQQVDRIIRQVPTCFKKAQMGQFVSVFNILDPLHKDDFHFMFGYTLTKPAQQTLQIEPDIVLHMHTLPAAPYMATCIEPSGEDRSFILLGKIAKWIEANGYRIVGPCREISYDLTSLDTWAATPIEMQVPVEPVSPFPLHESNKLLER